MGHFSRPVRLATGVVKERDAWADYTLWVSERGRSLGKAALLGTSTQMEVIYCCNVCASRSSRCRWVLR